MPNPVDQSPDALNVPTVQSAVPASTVTEVNIPSKIKPPSISDDLGVGKLKGPQDFFGEEESPDAINKRIDAAAPRERGPDGKFLPRKGEEAAPSGPPKAEPVSKPAAAKPKPTEPDPEPKIRIGDQEKTAAEWEAYHKALDEKINATGKPTEEKPPGVGKPEEQPPAAQDEDALREEWLEKTAAHLAPSQEEFDKMLADGDTKAFGRMMANVLLDTRKWVADQMKPHLERLDTELTPLAQMQQEAAQTRTEQSFLDSNPDIKAAIGNDEAKKDVHRSLCHDLSIELADMRQLVAQNPANRRAQARVEALEKDFLGEVAKETRIALGIGSAAPTPAPAPAAGKTPMPKPTPPAERPLNGDRPGSAGAPRTETQEARLARETLEAV